MIEPVFEYHAGEAPLLVSVPHDGKSLAPGMAERMSEAALALPDTDWHVARLYDFAKDLGASMIVANYSRYVVDLNRPADDTALYPGQLKTGLCPTETFAGEAIYGDADGITDAEIDDRREKFWQPYHDRIETTLAGLRERHGYALLWDAHSIASVVPRLFHGTLAVLNLGSNGNASSAKALARDVVYAATGSGYDLVVDGRFRGGYITRHYGQPDSDVHVLQLEIAQRGYMDEASGDYDEAKASRLQETLKPMLEAYLAAGAARYG